jgi:ubiquinone/menaquinone biosynthesis C-methylase UbiE
MLAKAVGVEGSVVGIDAAPEMIQYASRKARRLANCTFQPGAAEALAFPDSSFDVVASSLMMHHVPAELRLQAVCEMRRVLRPGGTLLLSDFTIPERGVWRLIASISGHDGDKWRRRITPLETLVATANLTELSTGDAPPWLHYVTATKQ